MRYVSLGIAFLVTATVQGQVTVPSDWHQNARILAVTAQQAILTYSAPAGEEDQPCVLEVSTSQTYTPLVPDVNGTLFTGANFDNRPGSYVNGRVRVVTLGKRTVETAADGTNYSRSLAAATTYYYRVTCPSSTGNVTATGAFATGLLPAGLGYGDPIPVDPSHPGSYLYPTPSATDRTATTVDPHTGVLVQNLVLPGDIRPRVTATGTAPAGSTTLSTNSTAFAQGEIISGTGIQPGTFAIAVNGSTVTLSQPTTQTLSGSAVSGGIIPGMGTTGGSQFCHPTPVRASDENKYGYNCLLAINGLGLYWIASDGETRFLGMVYTNNTFPQHQWAGNWANGGGQGVMIDVTGDPNTFYFPVPGTNTTPPWNVNSRYLVKGVYNGHTVGCLNSSRPCDADQTNIPSNATISPNFSFSALTPSDNNFDRSIQTLMSEFDPNWSTYAACCSAYIITDMLDGKILLRGWMSQDTFGWVAMFDPAATAATQTARYGTAAGCVDNPAVTGSNYAGAPGCLTASMGTFTGSAGSPFRWGTLHSALGGVALGSGMERVASNTLRLEMGVAYQVTLPNGLPGSGSACTMPQAAGSSYITDWPTAFWAKGCSTVAVSGDPTLSNPVAGYPSSIPAAPGDLVSFNSASTGSYELARLLDKGSDGMTWYLQRQYSPGGAATYTTIPPGGTLDMVPSNWGFGVGWWNYAGSTQRGVTDSTNTYNGDPLGSGHAAYENQTTYGRWSISDGAIVQGFPALYAQPGSEPGRLTNLTQFPITLQALPGFNGVSCTGNSSTPCSVESHPALSTLNPPSSAAYAFEVNNYPYTGDYTNVQASNVTLISGQLYRIRGTRILSNYKKIAYFANSGNRAMREVSGPSVQLTADSLTQFEWCAAYQAGECYSGSLPGDIYFNAPNITNAYCTNDWATLLNTISVANDICVSPAWSWTQAIAVQPLGADPQGGAERTISNALGRYKTQSNFWNSRITPDGSWLFSSVASDGLIKLFKIPPMAQDAVNRAQYVPVTVTLPSTQGADGAVVEFGYAEQGEGQFYCTARQERCVADSGTANPANPFYFESESYTPVPCVLGCAIVIPGISGRIVEYRLKMFSGSAVVYTSPLMVAAVP